MYNKLAAPYITNWQHHGSGLPYNISSSERVKCVFAIGTGGFLAKDWDYLVVLVLQLEHQWVGLVALVPQLENVWVDLGNLLLPMILLSLCLLL